MKTDFKASRIVTKSVTVATAHLFDDTVALEFFPSLKVALNYNDFLIVEDMFRSIAGEILNARAKANTISAPEVRGNMD